MSHGCKSNAGWQGVRRPAMQLLLGTLLLGNHVVMIRKTDSFRLGLWLSSKGFWLPLVGIVLEGSHGPDVRGRDEYMEKFVALAATVRPGRLA